MHIAHVSAKQCSAGGVKTLGAMIYINCENKSAFFADSAPGVFCLHLIFILSTWDKIIWVRYEHFRMNNNCAFRKREYTSLNAQRMRNDCEAASPPLSHLYTLSKESASELFTLSDALCLSWSGASYVPRRLERCVSELEVSCRRGSHSQDMKPIAIR